LKTKFNKEQLEAIEADLPLTIIAGPGSGKTTTIIEKIVKMVPNKEALKNYLILTFTNEAANNIIHKLEEKFSNEANKPITLNRKEYYIGTFHAIFYKLIREEKYELFLMFQGFENIKIISPNDDTKLFKRLVYEQYNPEGKLKIKESESLFEEIHGITIMDAYYNISRSVNRIPDSMKTIKENLLKASESDKSKEIEKLSLILENFYFFKKEEGLMSFNDILLYMYLILKNNQNLNQKIMKKFQYILIDEYQDTNPIQDAIVKILLRSNDCEVGDPFQSIYGFLDADIENIMRLVEEKNRNVIQLTKNYRSSKNIVEFTNDLTTLFNVHIPNFIECTSENKFVKNLPIEVKEYVKQEEKIIQHIKKSIKNGISPDEIAVITRTNFDTPLLEKKLLENNISFRKLSGKGFYEKKEIISIVDLIKVLMKDFSFMNFENVASFIDGLGIKTIEKVSKSYMNRKNKKDTISDIIEKEFNKNKKLQIMKKEVLEKNELTYFLLKNILESENFNIIKKLIKNGQTTKKRKEIEYNIDFFLNQIKDVLFKDSREELEEFLSVISLDNKKEKEKVDKSNQIILTTAHSAKGLEWNNCYLMNIKDGKFPSEKSLSFDKEIEEEKRLFYVAVSRAKEFLMITSDAEINQFVQPFLNNKYINSESGYSSEQNFWF